MERKDLLATFRYLSTWKRGTRRAPHKPILCLYSMAQLQAGKNRIDFYDACEPLEAILKNLLPNQRNPNAHYPFWYLRNDGIWRIENADNIPTRQGKPEPLKSELKNLHVKAGFTDEVVKLLLDDPSLIADSATEILNANFPESIHEDVLKLIGLDTEITKRPTSRNRDPKFRERILTTYGYRCAVCGYSLRLMEATIGLEAAHIKWHQAGGPDLEKNGLSLCCLHHKLFDRGIFTVDEEMQILVSNKTNGELAEQVILRFEGSEISLPRKKEHYPCPDYLHWHRSEVYAG